MGTVRANEPCGDWWVETVEPEVLVVRPGAGEPWRAFGKHLVTAVGAFALAAALSNPAWTGSFAPVMAPVAWLLALVSGLGLLSSVRAGRRAAGGARLTVRGQRGTVRGFPLAQGTVRDFFQGPLEVPAARVQAVRVTSHRGGADSSVQVRVALEDGGLLEGPACACPEGELPRAAQGLESVARLLAQRLGVGVRNE